MVRFGAVGEKLPENGFRFLAVSCVLINKTGLFGVFETVSFLCLREGFPDFGTAPKIHFFEAAFAGAVWRKTGKEAK